MLRKNQLSLKPSGLPLKRLPWFRQLYLVFSAWASLSNISDSILIIFFTGVSSTGDSLIYYGPALRWLFLLCPSLLLLLKNPSEPFPAKCVRPAWPWVQQNGRL